VRKHVALISMLIILASSAAACGASNPATLIQEPPGSGMETTAPEAPAEEPLGPSLESANPAVTEAIQDLGSENEDAQEAAIETLAQVTSSPR
jgi:hypothetical protein